MAGEGYAGESADMEGSGEEFALERLASMLLSLRMRSTEHPIVHMFPCGSECRETKHKDASDDQKTGHGVMYEKHVCMRRSMCWGVRGAVYKRA